ncbi:MAG: hypothetical protein A2293_15240 [Elusimicrobia bacterium RIFOXYB2_FULL_49_7]|nr:MAG: hypothetical protein A2293_15240 [Elusimicrobia bacterium RIFOXYB2_FULL_49_7]
MIFRITLFSFLALLSGCHHCTCRESAYRPFLSDNVAYIDTADNGFAKGWHSHERSDPMAWFDVHMHISKACSTEVLAKEAVTFWRKEFGTFDWAGGAIMAYPGSGIFDYAKTDSTVAVYLRLTYDNPDVKLVDSLFRLGKIRGVKLHMRPIYEKGLDYKIMDSDAWHAVYAKCGELGIPIIWHVNQRYTSPQLSHGVDKESAWKKLGYTNADVLKWFEGVANRYANTRFILAHFNFMGQGPLGALLDRHPNVYTDACSAWHIGPYHHLTVSEIETIRPFAIRYQDRIMFGTDFNLHTVQPDEDVRYWDRSYETAIRFIMQLELPGPVLSKIAYKNALKVLNMKQWFEAF